VLVQLVRRAVRVHVDDPDSRYRISKVVVMAGYLAVVVALVSGLSGRITGLTVALGAASAGIAFALQEVIASFAGWLAVAFGSFYKVGDRVQLGGIKGDVIDIGFLRTTLMECGAWVDGDLYNGRMVRVANSFVFKEPVFNYSGDFPFLWDEIVVPVKYGSDLSLAQTAFERVANDVTGDFARGAKKRWAELVRSYRIEDASLDPLVTLAATDNWVTFNVRYVVDPRARRLTKDALFRRILAAVDESGGKIAIASATFQLVEAPALDVRLSHK
jgi:small-conductance mechanosensitive channel